MDMPSKGLISRFWSPMENLFIWMNH